MAIPDRQDFMLPILKIAGDEMEHSNHEVYEILAQQFGLNETDRKERIPSDRDRTFDNYSGSIKRDKKRGCCKIQ